MSDPNPFSLPTGVSGLRFASAGYGRIAVVSDDLRVFSWEPGREWKALEDPEHQVDLVCAVPRGIALLTERRDAVGFWNPSEGTRARWTEYGEPSAAREICFDGGTAVRETWGEGRKHWEVLSLEDGGWVTTARVEVPPAFEVEVAWERGDGTVGIATDEGFFSLDPKGDPPRLEERLRWRGKPDTVPAWVRHGDSILVMSYRAPVTLLDLRTGAVECRGFPFLPGNEPLLARVLSGDRAGLAADVEFLGRVPLHVEYCAVHLLAFLHDAAGPVAAATTHGLVRPEDVVPATGHHGGKAVESVTRARDTVAWRFFLRPDETLAEAVPLLADSDRAGTMSLAIREAYGPASFERVLGASHDAERFDSPLHPDGLVGLVSHAGPACREAVLGALGSKSRSGVTFALVALRAGEPVFGELLREPEGRATTLLRALLSHPEDEIRLEAVITVGALGLGGFLENLVEKLVDVSERVRRAAVSSLCALRGVRADALPFVVDCARNHFDEEVRLHAVRLAEDVDEPALAGAALTALYDVSAEIRERAGRVLCNRTDRLSPGQILACADAVLLNLAATRLAPDDSSGRRRLGEAFESLLESLGSELFTNFDPEVPETFLDLSREHRYAGLGLILVVVLAGGFLVEVETSSEAIQEVLESLAGVVKSDPDETLSRLSPTQGEILSYASGRWGSADRLRLARRIAGVDEALGERIAVIAFLSCRPGDGKAGTAGGGRPGALHERLRAVSWEQSPVAWAHDHVREVATRRTPGGLLALLALARFEGDWPSRDRIRQAILSGETSGCEAFLALALPFFPSGERKPLLVSFLEERAIPLEVRARAWSALRLEDGMDDLADATPAFDLEFVTCPRFPAEDRHRRAKGAAPARSEAVLEAFWKARELEVALTDDECWERAWDFAESGRVEELGTVRREWVKRRFHLAARLLMERGDESDISAIEKARAEGWLMPEWAAAACEAIRKRSAEG